MSKQTAYVAWQDPEERDWHVIGRLEFEGEVYSFQYTKGCRQSNNFVAFSGMDDLDKTYFSKSLFPIFSNRVLSPKRPEYEKFLSWMGLDGGKATTMDLLVRSGGIRGTDRLELFPLLEENEHAEIEYEFFVHGNRYLPESSSKRLSLLLQGERLMACLDIQNPYDENAIYLRTENEPELLGYVPRYLSKELAPILKDNPRSISFRVSLVSDDAPSEYKLLCQLSGSVNQANDFMSSDEYQPVSK
ncbi:HIRAN domain-containing protein [Marinomonas fungiae]|uniref:HIRAN domain-containing protein n=1 Tax=Marinomonas fungiae TaxID=1137284 RepID=UPI003A90E842